MRVEKVGLSQTNVKERDLKLTEKRKGRSVQPTAAWTLGVKKKDIPALSIKKKGSRQLERAGKN